MTERAAARADRLAAALGYDLAQTSVTDARIMIGDVPASAAAFLARNFWVATPPPDVQPSTAVTAAAWTFLVRDYLTVPDPSDPTGDELWRLCAAACM